MPEKIYLKRRRHHHLLAHGHCIVLGHTGSGKTSFTERVAAKKYAMGHKILFFDLTGECSLYGLPEDDPKTLDILYGPYSRFKQFPRAFPHRVLFPLERASADHATKDELVIELPRTKDKKASLARTGGWLEWRPFQVPYESLGTAEFAALMRHLTPQSRAILEILKSMKSIRSMEDLLKQVIEVMPKDATQMLGVESDTGAKAPISFHSTLVSLITMLMNVQKKGLICRRKDKITVVKPDGSEEKIPAALDWRKEQADQETWATLSLAGLGPDEKAVVYYVSGHQITAARLRYKLPPATFVLPEFHNFAPRKGTQSMLRAGGVSPNQVTEMWLSQFRKQGVDILADSQSPKKIDGISLEHFTWFAVGKNPWPRELFKQESFPYIPEEVIEDFKHFKTGTWFLGQVGYKDYEKPFIACPGLSKHKQRHETPLEVLRRYPGVEWVVYRASVRQTVRGGLVRKETAATEARKKHGAAVKTALVKVALSMKRKGFSYGKIAEAVGRSRRTVEYWLSPRNPLLRKLGG